MELSQNWNDAIKLAHTSGILDLELSPGQPQAQRPVESIAIVILGEKRCLYQRCEGILV